MGQQDELKKLTAEQETYLVMSRKVTEVRLNRQLELYQEKNKTEKNKTQINKKRCFEALYDLAKGKPRWSNRYFLCRCSFFFIKE